MNVILEATPIVSDGPAWFAAVGVVSTMVVSLFKEYMPIIGKRIDVEKYKKEIADLTSQLEALEVKLEAALAESAEISNNWAKVSGYLFAIRKQLREMGFEEIGELIESYEKSR